MFDSATPVETGQDDWAERCRYWLDALASEAQPRKRRERESRPLVLTGHGLSMRVDKACLLIKDGNTHFPAEKREWRFFKGGLNLPTKIVVLDGSGSVTLDAIDWLAEQGIAFVRLKYDGSVAALMSPTGYAADLEKVAWQKATRVDEQARLQFLVKVLIAKTNATLKTLATEVPHSEYRDHAISVCENALIRFSDGSLSSKPQILGLEGRIAQAYFSSWQCIEIDWVKTGRHPIPDEWRTFTTRYSPKQTTDRMYSRSAADPINAMLNYAYGMLTHRGVVQCVADGYDPTLGIIHGRRQRDLGKSPAFALDIIEPFRPEVDAAVLRFIQERSFSGADFQLQSNGVCRLNPELARQLTAMTSRKSGRLGDPQSSALS